MILWELAFFFVINFITANLGSLFCFQKYTDKESNQIPRPKYTKIFEENIANRKVFVGSFVYFNFEENIASFINAKKVAYTFF